MNQQQPAPANTNRARDRYAKRRRRQLAATVAGGLVVVALAVVLTITILAVRSCAGTFQTSTPRFSRNAQDSRYAREVAVREFKPAPWLIEFDGGRVFLATDTRQRSGIFNGWPVDKLSAYALDDEQPLWQSPIEAEYSGFHLGGNKLVGFKQYLSGQSRLQIDTYDADNGAPAWSFGIEGATHGCVSATGSLIVLGYQLSDGYRLAAYDLMKEVRTDAATEAKSWGIRLPLQGLARYEFTGDVFDELTVRIRPDVVIYKQFNVIGFVKAVTGERLREYAAPAYIHNFAVDPDRGVCYLLFSGNQEGTYAVQAIPYPQGGPSSLHRFEGAGEDAKLLALDGNLIVAYPQLPVEREEMRTKLLCFHENELVLEKELGGTVRALFNHEAAPGVFFAAANTGVDDMGLPSGRGALWRFDTASGEARLAARYSSPIMAAKPFKEDCLILLRGGDIYSFIPSAGASKKLRRTRHPILTSLASPDKSRLAVFAATQKHYADEPGQPMQVIVFE